MKAQTDTSDRSVLLKKESKQSAISGKKYKIKVTGLNSAVISLKLTAKSMEIFTPAPEALKTVLPGITSSLTGGSQHVTEGIETLEELIASVNKGLARLNNLKEISDELYKVTMFTPSASKAKETLEAVIQRYNNDLGKVNAENIENHVRDDIYFINTVRQIADNLVINDSVLNNKRLAHVIAEINNISDLTKSKSYQSYIEFIKDLSKQNLIFYQNHFMHQKTLST